MNWSQLLHPDIYNYIISYITPELQIKNKMDFCLIFITMKGNRERMKRCTLCTDCNIRNTYNIICSDCDKLRWFELT